jgi:hypothetical protein
MFITIPSPRLCRRTERSSPYRKPRRSIERDPERHRGSPYRRRTNTVLARPAVRRTRAPAEARDEESLNTGPELALGVCPPGHVPACRCSPFDAVLNRASSPGPEQRAARSARTYAPRELAFDFVHLFACQESLPKLRPLERASSNLSLPEQAERLCPAGHEPMGRHSTRT